MFVTPQTMDLEREIEALIKRAGNSLRQADDRRHTGAAVTPDENSPPAPDSSAAEGDRPGS